MDVRCGCERLRHDLKNPSKAVDAESSQRSALLFDRRPRSARVRAGTRNEEVVDRKPYHVNSPPLRMYVIRTCFKSYVCDTSTHYA